MAAAAKAVQGLICVEHNQPSATEVIKQFQIHELSEKCLSEVCRISYPLSSAAFENLFNKTFPHFLMSKLTISNTEKVA